MKRWIAVLVASTLLTTNFGFVYAAEAVESKENIIQNSEQTKNENDDEREAVETDIEEMDNSDGINTQEDSSTENTKEIKSEQDK